MGIITTWILARTARAAQPYCLERLTAALPGVRARADTKGSELFALLLPEEARGSRLGFSADAQAGPILLAVGPQSLYVFDCSPKRFGWEIRTMASSWQKDEISVLVEYSGGMMYMVVTTRSGEKYGFEVSAISSFTQVQVGEFLELAGGKDYRFV